MAKPWEFVQLGGEKRSVTLAGASAPHGRIRRDPIVTDEIKLRRQRTYYSGSNVPTTHVFGVMFEPWTLKGRFADKHIGGKGSCLRMIALWQQIVTDGQRVRVSWGDVASVIGLVDRFVAKREGESEAAYEIELLVDEQPSAWSTKRRLASTDDGPRSLCQALQSELLNGAAAIPQRPSASGMAWGFLDTLDSLVSIINEPVAMMLSVAGEFDSFASGTIDQLERLKAGVAQARTATLTLQRTYETTQTDAVALTRTSDSDVQWFAARSALDVASLRMLAILDEIDRQTELARRGSILSTFVARAGDTWESIATLAYGGPEGAGRIREANGITYGALPVAGREYVIPAAEAA